MNKLIIACDVEAGQTASDDEIMVEPDGGVCICRDGEELTHFTVAQWRAVTSFVQSEQYALSANEVVPF